VYSIVYFVKYIAEHSHREPTGDESREYGVQYNTLCRVQCQVYTTDRRDSACEPIGQLMDTQRPTTQRSRSIASGLKDMGRFPIFGACEEKHPMGLIPRGHNRKVIVTVSGLNGMGSRGSGNRASASLPLKASLCGSFSAATRKKCVARARAHLVQEREIDLQVCVFFPLANSDSNLVVDRQCRCESCGKAAGFSELLVARNGLQCRVVGTCVFVFFFLVSACNLGQLDARLYRTKKEKNLTVKTVS
jgi:hypothetical protein